MYIGHATRTAGCRVSYSVASGSHELDQSSHGCFTNGSLYACVQMFSKLEHEQMQLTVSWQGTLHLLLYKTQAWSCDLPSFLILLFLSLRSASDALVISRKEEMEVALTDIEVKVKYKPR